MKTIIVKTQAELDALPKSFNEYTVIEIHSDPLEQIIVRVARESSQVEAWGSSRVVARESSRVVARESSQVEARESSQVEAWGSSQVEARESSRVVAWGSSRVVAWGSSQVEAWESSQVEAWGSSQVEARESSRVVAWGSSRVVAWGSSQVEAWGSSRVVARESSRVVAWGSSQVEAWGSSQVEAWGSSRVEAWGSSRVVARESSRVVAWGNVSTYLQSDFATISLWMFSCCFKLAKGSINKKSKTCTVITPKIEKGVDAWLKRHGIEPKKQIIVFKRVSKDWKTQERTPNETVWEPGKTLEHHSWNPKQEECGEGKYHACPTAYFCDEFRSDSDDKYVAIQVDKKDLFCWDDEPQYPHKIAFRKGTVLHEVNRFGEKV